MGLKSQQGIFFSKFRLPVAAKLTNLLPKKLSPYPQIIEQDILLTDHLIPHNVGFVRILKPKIL